MKITRYINIFIIMALFAALAPTGVVTASANKVDICHREGNGSFILINISNKAYPAHDKHGDAKPGQAVPGKDGFVFDDACKVVQLSRVYSAPLNYSPYGWGGWSCPSGTPNLFDGGYLPESASVTHSLAWVPGASVDDYSYPTTPWEYKYSAGETGWIVQNDETGKTLTIFVDCYP